MKFENILTKEKKENDLLKVFISRIQSIREAEENGKLTSGNFSITKKEDLETLIIEDMEAWNKMIGSLNKLKEIANSESFDQKEARAFIDEAKSMVKEFNQYKNTLYEIDAGRHTQKVAAMTTHGRLEFSNFLANQASIPFALSSWMKELLNHSPNQLKETVKNEINPRLEKIIQELNN